MPLFQPPNIDVANLASKLPRPLQWPAGAIMGGLKSALGGDDPAGSVMGAAAGGGPMEELYGELKPVTEHLEEPIKSLVEALHQPLSEPNLNAVVAGNKVTGLRPPPAATVMAPEGFDFGLTKSGASRPKFEIPRDPVVRAAENSQRDFYSQFKSAARQGTWDTRTMSQAKSLPNVDVVQREVAPAVRGLQDIGGIIPPAGEAATPKALTQNVSNLSNRTTALKKSGLSEDLIRQIRKAQGTNEGIGKQFGVPKETARSIRSRDSWNWVKD